MTTLAKPKRFVIDERISCANSLPLASKSPSMMEFLDEMDHILMDLMGVVGVSVIIQVYYDDVWLHVSPMMYAYTQRVPERIVIEDRFFHHQIRFHFPFLYEDRFLCNTTPTCIFGEMRDLYAEAQATFFSDISQGELTLFHAVCLSCSPLYRNYQQYCMGIQVYQHLWKVMEEKFPNDYLLVLEKMMIFVQLATRLAWIRAWVLWKALMWSFILKKPDRLMIEMHFCSTSAMVVSMMFHPLHLCIEMQTYPLKRTKDDFKQDFLNFKEGINKINERGNNGMSLDLDVARSQAKKICKSCLLNGRGVVPIKYS